MYATILNITCCFQSFLPTATPVVTNLYPYGLQQSDDEFKLGDSSYSSYSSRCLEIKTDRFGFPFFGKRRNKLYVGLSLKICK